jgi:hypothetical protein
MDVFGTTNVLAVVDLPCHLDRLEAHLPANAAYTADQFIDQHTLFPYYTRFVPQDRLLQARRDMHGSGGKAVHMRLGVMASRVRAPQWLQFCPACAAEDRQEQGERYWHRTHQLPGIEVCHKHGIPLENSQVSIGNRTTRYEFVSAEQAHLSMHRNPCLLPYHHLAEVLARDAAWLLQEGEHVSYAEQMRERYRAILQRHGLVTAGGSVRIQHLMERFRAYYPDDFLVRIGCTVDSSSSDNWLVRLVRAPDNAQNPVLHLLLMHCLDVRAEKFFSDEFERVPTSAARTSSVIPPDQDERARQRQIWLAALEQDKAAGVKALRAKCSATYAWLYRNDRAWLKQHTPYKQHREPAPSRIDWEKRDQQLVDAVRAAAVRLQNAPGKPRQMTTAALGREAGCLALLQKHRDKLPQTVSALDSLIEDRVAYAIRRIEWAAKTLQQNGSMPKEWELIRLAGVARMTNDPRVRAALQEALQ